MFDNRQHRNRPLYVLGVVDIAVTPLNYDNSQDSIESPPFENLGDPCIHENDNITEIQCSMGAYVSSSSTFIKRPGSPAAASTPKKSWSTAFSRTVNNSAMNLDTENHNAEYAVKPCPIGNTIGCNLIFRKNHLFISY